MIDKALDFLKAQLNEYIRVVQPSITDDKVLISNIITQAGQVPTAIAGGKIVFTLVNVEEERSVKAQSPYLSNGTTVSVVNPEIKLNLYLLVTSHFDDYKESLKFLSYAISFFQAKAFFNKQNSPSLDTSIEKLVLDLYTIPIEQQNYLWASVGAKYLPSVVYKIRLLTVQQGVALESGAAIGQMDSQASQN